MPRRNILDRHKMQNRLTNPNLTYSTLNQNTNAIKNSDFRQSDFSKKSHFKSGGIGSKGQQREFRCTNIVVNPAEQQKKLGGVNFFGFKLKYNTEDDKIFWESVIEYWTKTDIIITNVDYKKEVSNSDGSGNT